MAPCLKMLHFQYISMEYNLLSIYPHMATLSLISCPDYFEFIYLLKFHGPDSILLIIHSSDTLQHSYQTLSFYISVSLQQ